MNKREDGEEPLNDMDAFIRKMDELMNGIEKNYKQMYDKKRGGNMDKSDNAEKFMWFSMKPEDYEFPKNQSPTWASHPHERLDEIAPDLASFMASAGLLLQTALFTPMKTGQGRLTQFFSWIDAAKSRMEAGDFTDDDRYHFSEWCKEIAAMLRKAEEKSGLWLTEDEDGLVECMKTGVFDGNSGTMLDFGGGAD